MSEYRVWIQINLAFDDTSDIRYPDHRSASYWWRCKLPFVPGPFVILTSLGDCPVQRLAIEGPATYDVNDGFFICRATPVQCAGADDFELKKSLLHDVCTKKPF